MCFNFIVMKNYYLIISCFFVLSNMLSLNAQEFMGGDVRIERLSPAQCSVYVDIYYEADTSYQGHSIPLEMVPAYVQRLDWVEKKILTKGLVSFHYEAESFLNTESFNYFKVDTLFVVEDVVNHPTGTLNVKLDNFVRNSSIVSITNSYITNFENTQDSYYIDQEGILHYDLNAEDQEGNEVVFAFDPYVMLSSYYALPEALNIVSIDPLTGILTWDKPLQPGKYFFPFYLEEQLPSGYPLDWKTRYQIIEITEEDIITNTQQEELAEGVDLFPNPATDHLQIQLPSLSTSAALTIQNLQGQALYQNRLQLSPTLQTHEIQVAGWPAGVYVLRVQSGERQWVRKFVVE